MKPRVAILAAMPRELAQLVQDWPINGRPMRGGCIVRECDSAIAVSAGMGRERVTLALELAEACGPICSVISVGYAGALHSGMVRNKVYWPGLVIDAMSGDRFTCDGGVGTLLTIDRIASREEKPLLKQRWQADLVDMEAATVAKLAAARGLSFHALKVVSDAASDRLPDFQGFVDDTGTFRESAFARHVMLHPWLIPASIRLGRQSARASRWIAIELREWLKKTE